MSDKIKEVIKFIAKNAEQEAILLNPNPAWEINVHLLLDKIAELYDLSEEVIDDILTSTQQA